MRRHGWTLCLGLLIGGPAGAQPPADENAPPAPVLPGVVVAQERGAQPLVAPDRRAAEPSPLPLPDPKAAEPEIPGSPPPAELPGPTAAAPVGTPCATPAAGKACGKGAFGSITDWCLFRSRATQSGHFITPYRPPLIAWFPCEPKCGPCGAWAPPLRMAAPVPAAAAPGPMVTPPSPPPGTPATTPPQVGCPSPVPETDVLSGFLKTPEGLNFAPGGAPMANPTTQVHRVSH